jgi:hypothetical protein
MSFQIPHVQVAKTHTNRNQKRAWLYPKWCVYIYIPLSQIISQKLVVPNNWSWLDSKYIVTFHLPTTMLFMTYSLYAIIYRYIYQYIHKKFIISPTYHDIPCTNSYILYQSRYSICLYKNVYIYISHWSIIYLSLQCHCLYHWLFMYLCIYI